MKPRRANQRNQALTLVEVVVVIAVLMIMAALAMPFYAANRHWHERLDCVNNLKLINLAFQTWAENKGNKFPMEISVVNGGAQELVAMGNTAACFQMMSNELAKTKILHCPQETRQRAARNFTTDFSSSNISYFIGLDANKGNTQRILSGDDNFDINGAPTKSGLLLLSTNDSVVWAKSRHFRVGNLLMVDGSVEQTTISGLMSLFQQTGLATNRLAIP
jgi:type II secretory pathway pseudopilin PulG